MPKEKNAKVFEVFHLIKKLFSSYSNPDYLWSYPGTFNHSYMIFFNWKKSDLKGLKADTAE